MSQGLRVSFWVTGSLWQVQAGIHSCNISLFWLCQAPLQHAAAFVRYHRVGSATHDTTLGSDRLPPAHSACFGIAILCMQSSPRSCLTCILCPLKSRRVSAGTVPGVAAVTVLVGSSTLTWCLQCFCGSPGDSSTSVCVGVCAVGYLQCMSRCLISMPAHELHLNTHLVA